MITPENSLIAAVIASPDDDLPRLVAANWHDENNQPNRAEYIRGAIELAKGGLYGKERVKLEKRMAELRRNGGLEWGGPPIPEHDGESALFKRGYPHSQYVGESFFTNQKQHDLVFNKTPVRDLTLNYSSDDPLAGFISNPDTILNFSHIDKVQGLSFVNSEFNTDDALKFAKSGKLNGLKRLSFYTINGDISSGRAAQNVLNAFFSEPDALTALTELSFMNIGITDLPFKPEDLPNLTKLNLAWTNVDLGSIATFFEATKANIRELALTESSEDYMGCESLKFAADKAAKRITKSRAFQSVEDLDIHIIEGCNSAVATSVLRDPNSKVKKLALHGTIGKALLREIAKSKAPLEEIEIKLTLNDPSLRFPTSNELLSIANRFSDKAITLHLHEDPPGCCYSNGEKFTYVDRELVPIPAPTPAAQKIFDALSNHPESSDGFSSKTVTLTGCELAEIIEKTFGKQTTGRKPSNGTHPMPLP